MFTINKLTDGSLNYLKLTKADSLSFVVEVYNPTDNQPYQFKQGDKITLLVKRFYSDQNALMQVDGNIISNTNIATFNLGGVDTNSLTYGGYRLSVDIQENLPIGIFTLPPTVNITCYCNDENYSFLNICFAPPSNTYIGKWQTIMLDKAGKGENKPTSFHVVIQATGF